MNVLAGKTYAVVATLTLPLLLLTGCSHATKPVPSPVTLGFCGSNPQVRPDVVLVVCDTDDITAENLTWSDWGKATGTARGSATVDLCAYEDCASGDYVLGPYRDNRFKDRALLKEYVGVLDATVRVP